MLSFIDRFLNSITMYRLVLQGLMLMALYAIVLGFLGFLSFGGLSLIYSVLILLVTCHFANVLFSKLFSAPVNTESSYITALILFFILLPAESWGEMVILALAGLLAIASKFLIALRARHIFNPVAIALVIMSLLGEGIGVWWVGTAVMLPATLILGLLIVRKIRKFMMFGAFLVSSLAVGLVVGIPIMQTLVSWPIIFLGTVMLTEPFTLPPRRRGQIIYGILVGILSSVPFSFGRFYSSPELALIIGNLYSYALSLKRRIFLTLREKREVAREVFEFSFKPDHQFAFKPGQFLEWTLPHDKSDTRGVRRYFTIASSPTESEVLLGVKIAEQSSSFKAKLKALEENEGLVAGQLSGDFVLSENKEEKLVFIAGGIGVTPFRSMVKYLIDKGEMRDITLFYSVKVEEEIAYKDIWSEGEKMGLKFIPLVAIYINKEMIEEEVPDYKLARFYLSGPNAMVENYKKLLKSMGIAGRQIKTDYFPGF